MIAKSLSVYDPPVGDPGYDSDPSTEAPPWPSTAHEQAVILQQTKGDKKPIPECETFNGHDTPGGFGYLTGDGCTSQVTSDSWAQGETGNNAKDCDISTLWKKVIQIPVFDCMQNGSDPKPSGAPTGDCNDYATDGGTGAKNWYHIAGWASFYVSGFQTGGLGASAERSVLTNKTCKSFTPGSGSSDRCLMGWFVSGVLADSPIVGPPTSGGIDLGTYALALAG